MTDLTIQECETLNAIAHKLGKLAFPKNSIRAESLANGMCEGPNNGPDPTFAEAVQEMLVYCLDAQDNPGDYFF